ncbi:hypothetical protein [Halorubrum sp. AJ67]|uniref:DUF7332 family protein n=1 Tax=Halorubrum sp. AJ67 TaxID=1173487 RepID=UPI0003DCC01C|nr:hypothetical protein [Halorubrum sp. AJ67]CDK38212.1 putative signal peptide protein [Halorubrum sp. AJ67]
MTQSKISLVRVSRYVPIIVAIALLATIGLAMTATPASAANYSDELNASEEEMLASTNDTLDNHSELSAEATTEPLTGCFAGSGHALDIGNRSATIDGLVHASILTDPTNGNEFGVELAGQINDYEIISLAAGVRLSRSGLLEDGVNPFAAFDLLYNYNFQLPMFTGMIDQSAYTETTPPLTSAAGEVEC